NRMSAVMELPRIQASPKGEMMLVLGKRASASGLSVPALAVPRFHCPKCGLEQPRGESCGRCGIVFRKFAKKSTAPPAPPAAAPAAAPQGLWQKLKDKLGA